MRTLRVVRTVLVTGASTGIGEACAQRLVADGWTVFAGVRKVEDGERLREAHPGDLRPLILDVTQADHVGRVLDEITTAADGRGLQGLVNNAGVGVGGPFEFLRDEDWRFVFDVNFFGVIALTRAALPLLTAGSGRVVTIGSIGGRIGSPGLGPYSASKHALEAVAESTRLEFTRAGSPVRMILVEPGAIATPIWDKADASVEALERLLDAAEGPLAADGERYRWLIDQSRGFVEEGRTKGIAPSHVADAVEHALTASRPKARYLVGTDAKIAGHVIARLPDRVRESLLVLRSKQQEALGATLRAAMQRASLG